jgi:hypothetical protein
MSHNKREVKKMNISASALMQTYLLTVKGEQIKLCLYQEINETNENYGEVWFEIEDDEDRDIDLKQIT